WRPPGPTWRRWSGRWTNSGATARSPRPTTRASSPSCAGRHEKRRGSRSLRASQDCGGAKPGLAAQHHLAALREVLALHLHDVEARREVGGFERERLRAGGGHAVEQRGDAAAEDVERLDAHLLRPVHLELDLRARGERVREGLA